MPPFGENFLGHRDNALGVDLSVSDGHGWREVPVLVPGASASASACARTWLVGGASASARARSRLAGGGFGWREVGLPLLFILGWGTGVLVFLGRDKSL